MGWDESLWQKVAATALVGTERQPFTVPTATGLLGKLLSQLNSPSPEAVLLTTAATLSLYKRAGGLPAPYSVPRQETCDRTDLPRCSLRAARLLQQMLQGQFTALLPEWFTLAAEAGQRVPELQLPELLDLARQQGGLRAILLPVLGQRGRWLATQNSDWKYAIEVATAEDWETGNQAARLLYLQTLRSTHPEKARELLQATWKQEAAGDRSKFLATFRTGLSSADEPLLAAALGDRSKEVRRVAADLLASLPTSQFCQFITSHTTSYVILNREPTLSITVNLPTEFDPSLLQYGIESKPTQQFASILGEKAWWLLQLIAATPLSVWTNGGIPVAELVNAAKYHQWEAVLLDGWARATKRQQDAEWSEALLQEWMIGKRFERNVALLDINPMVLLEEMPPDRQNAFLISLLRPNQENLDDLLTLWSFRDSYPQWSVELAQLVLDRLGTYMTQHTTFSNLVWDLKAVLQEFARCLPVSLVPEVLKLQSCITRDSPWAPSIEEFVAILLFRKEMAEAFAGDGG
ncbi:MAG: DUF5691 domain-containing protein [Leptolyngbyaceae cyanobacterium bins.59]|nr:DUF5691 domain-containing protein [Leptolyngbyaceae cyanobacterium bins.59]